MSGWLIDTLFYTGLLIGFVLLVRRPAGRLFGPQFAYMLWALPFLRLLMPPIVLPASLAPKPEPVEPATASVDFVDAAALMPTSSVESAATAAATPAWTWLGLAEIALSVWLGVALAFLAWRVVTYRRMRRELLAEARPVGEAGKVRLVETPAVPAPIAFGVFDKVVALPPLFMAQPDRLARDLAIEHELAHHRGHDLLANFAAQALLALHWFNPLAWYGWRAMRRDQEAACDARVLAGRCREERLRYAALIAGIATGPRSIAFERALAAPMACPVLGERSIIHRLRSLPMSEMSRRRRWLGRSLIAAGALALPLTASFSYAAGAQEQLPEPPAPPEPVAAPAAPEAPEAPDAPDAPEAPDAESVRTMVVERGGVGEPIVRQFAMRRDGIPPVPPVPPVPPMPRVEFHGNPEDPEFRARMEKFGREMDEWGKTFGEQYAAQAREWAETARRNAPEVVESCDENERLRTRTEDGRPRVVICQRQIQLAARSSLRGARAAIAHNREISDAVRAEILRDLDEEIARIERGED